MGGGVGVQGGRQQQPKLPSIQVGLHLVSIYIYIDIFFCSAYSKDINKGYVINI